jgi:hypothetical protein
MRLNILKRIYKRLVNKLVLLSKTNLFLILIDILIFLRSLYKGIKLVSKGESTNKIHTKIKQEIKKKNGKILLVGCGPSVLDVPISKFQKINKSTYTVGMSYACHLSLNYDLYFVEFAGKSQPYLYETDRDGIFFPVIEKYKKKEILQIVHKFSAIENFFERKQMKIPIEIPSHIINSSYFSIRLASYITRFTKYLGFGFQISGSLSYIIFKLIDYGAKEIILAGIDLDESGYFFMDKKWNGKKLKDPYFYINKNEGKRKMHKTNDPDFHKITMKEFLVEISKIHPNINFKILINKGNLKKDFQSIFNK